MEQLFIFLRTTQQETFKKLAIADVHDPKDINRLKFLARLSGEIGKRGVIDVLRKGVDHGPVHFDLFYGTPPPGNAKAEKLQAENRFSITRQLGYSMDETRCALVDLRLRAGEIECAISRLEREIDLLREYRTRLVTDVVTGKLDVRHAASRLDSGAIDDAAPVLDEVPDENGSMDDPEAEEL